MDLPLWTGVSSSEEVSCCRWTHTCIANDLGALLSSPLCRKGNQAKTIDFFNAVHNVIISRHFELSSKKFISELFSNHISGVWMLWYGHSNWKDVLGEEDFKLVTTFHKMEQKVEKEGGESVVKLKSEQVKVDNVSSVVELLAIITQRCTDNEHFEDNEKEKLGWFLRSKDGQWQFDYQLYANYWNKKFPQLELFLWWQFHDSNRWPLLDDFYPKLSNSHLELQQIRGKTAKRCTPVMRLLHQLSEALQNELEKGAVMSRYGKNAETLPVLEFWTMDDKLVQKILDNHSSVQIQGLEDSVTCLWFGDHQNVSSNVPVDARVTLFQRGYAVGEISKTDFLGTIFVANKISDIADSCVLESCVRNAEKLHRTIIFTSVKHRENIEMKCVKTEFVKKVDNILKIGLQEISVSWKELKEEFSEYLVEQKRVSLQNKTIRLLDLLPGNEWVRNQLLSKLNGNMLTTLLSGRKGVFLNKQKLPCYLTDGNYQERRFFSKSTFNSSVFSKIRELPEWDVFVVAGISIDMLKTVVNDCAVEIAVVDNFPSVLNMLGEGAKMRIFLVTSQDSSDIFYYDCGNDDTVCVNIHCLFYSQESGQFQWVRTHGDSSNIDKLFKVVASLVEENEWLNTCLQDTDRIIFVTGKQGTGKFCALASVVGKLVKTCNDLRIMLNINMIELVDVLQKNFQMKDFRKAVVSAITNLTCSSDFEINLLEYWLMEEWSNRMIRFEIILENFDQLLVGLQNSPLVPWKNADKEMALRVMRLLSDESAFTSVRVWATVEHLSDEILEEFGSCCCGYQLEPPTEQDCIDILCRDWVGIWRKLNGDNEAGLDSEKLAIFARQCIQAMLSKDHSHISGTLVQCRMIAEIYSSIVIAGNFTLEDEQNNSLIVVLHQKLLDSRLDQVAEPQREEMDRWYTYCAIKMLFPKHEESTIRSLLQLPEKTENELNSTEFGTPDFIHKSFADYLVARFFHKNVVVPFLNGSGIDSILYVYFRKYLWHDVLAVTYLDSHSDCPRVHFKHPVLCYFLNALLLQETPQYSFPKNVMATLLAKINEFYKNDLFLHKSVLIAPKFSSANEMGFSNIMALLVSSPKEILSLYSVMALCHQFDFVRFTIDNNLHSGLSSWQNLCEVSANAAFGNCRYGIIHWVVIGLTGHFKKEFEEIKNFVKYIVQVDRYSLEQVDIKGRTPLLLLLNQFKVKSNYGVNLFMPMLEFLVVELGANVHATDINGNTVLHFTHECVCQVDWCHDDSNFLEEEYFQVAKFLLENGCSENTVNAVNSKGQTPFLRAYEKFGGKGFATELGHLFEKYGASTKIKPEGVCTLLHVALNEYLDPDEHQVNEFGDEDE